MTVSSSESQESGRLLCYCNNVKYDDVRAAVELLDATHVAQVTRHNKAGGGCRSCHPDIELLIEEHRAAHPRGFVSFLKRLFFRS